MSQDNLASTLKAFPEAESGMQRLVFQIPDKTRDESYAFKVELIPGKTMAIDGINHYRMGLSIAAKTLRGWGYTYYTVSGKDLAMSTLVGVPAGTQQTQKFVAGKSLLINYNSRLPIVIYAPKGYEVKYRIWRADPSLTPAEQG